MSNPSNPSNYALALSAAERMSRPECKAEREQLADHIDHWVGQWEGDKLRWPAEIAAVAGSPHKAAKR